MRITSSGEQGVTLGKWFSYYPRKRKMSLYVVVESDSESSRVSQAPNGERAGQVQSSAGERSFLPTQISEDLITFPLHLTFSKG